jgi:hypothetical protein
MLTDELRRAELRVFCPHQPVRFISARLTGQISGLHVLWPGIQKTFIFGGIKLSETMTFAEYGIRDGDSIIALSETESPETGLWISLTRDRDSLNETMQWMLDPGTSAEAARLRDLHMTRVEQRPRVYDRFCATFAAPEARTRPARGTKIATEAPRSPSPDALPLLWNCEIDADAMEKKQ